MKEQQQNIDLKTTTALNPDEGVIFQQGFVLRKVSKFITGGTEDSIMPIPVFFDPKTSKILTKTLPQELREEYKEYLID